MYYLLFAGYDYSYKGGWDDFKGAFTSIEAAKEAATLVSEELYDWYQIVDFAPRMAQIKVLLKAKGEWDDDNITKYPKWEMVP